jgi:hypothetical protein
MLVSNMANELLIGFGGAVVGGLSAIAAAYQSHRHNLALESVQNEKRIDGILEAIRCELIVIQDFYDADIGQDLKNVKDGESYDGHFSMMTEKYFIVYPNNTEIVGQIGDPVLVKSIVTTYTKANLLIEGFRMNNWYLERTAELQDKRDTAYGELTALQEPTSAFTHSLALIRKDNLQSIVKEATRSINHYFKVRSDHTKLLKASDIDLHNEVKALGAKIDAYRQRHPVKMD